MFQLIYLTFTAPRADPAAFRVLTQQLKDGAGEPGRAARQRRSREALDAALTQNHPRAQPMTPARVDQMNLDKSLAFYKARFADASDFTFVFVGSFDARDAQAAGRALPGQPAGHAQPRDREGRRHSSAARRRRDSRSGEGSTRRARSASCSPGPFENDETHRVIVRAMAGDAGRQPAHHAAGGARRHLWGQRRAALHEASGRRSIA